MSHRTRSNQVGPSHAERNIQHEKNDYDGDGRDPFSRVIRPEGEDDTSKWRLRETRASALHRNRSTEQDDLFDDKEEPDEVWWRKARLNRLHDRHITGGSRKRRAFREASRAFFAEWSGQGFNHIYAEAPVLRRVFWAIIVGAFMALTAWLVIRTVDQYLRYEVVTQVFVEPGDAILLPDITVCSLQPFRRTELNNPRLNPLNTTGFTGALNMSGGANSVFSKYMYHVMGQKPRQDCSTITELTAADWRSISERVRLVIPNQIIRAHHCRSRSEVIKRCRFKGQACQDAFWQTVPDQRYCKCWRYQMPPEPQFKISRGGAGKYAQKLHLELETGSTNSIPFLFEESGIRLVAHARSSDPFPELSGMSLSPGFFYEVGFRQRQIKRLGEPYSDCENNDKVNKCVRSKMASQILGTCGCKYEFFDVSTRPRDKDKCTSIDLSCIETVIHTMEAPVCGEPCSTFEYPHTVSAIAWPSTEQAQLTAIEESDRLLLGLKAKRCSLRSRNFTAGAAPILNDDDDLDDDYWEAYEDDDSGASVFQTEPNPVGCNCTCGGQELRIYAQEEWLPTPVVFPVVWIQFNGIDLSDLTNGGEEYIRQYVITTIVAASGGHLSAADVFDILLRTGSVIATAVFVESLTQSAVDAVADGLRVDNFNGTFLSLSENHTTANIAINLTTEGFNVNYNHAEIDDDNFSGDDDGSGDTFADSGISSGSGIGSSGGGSRNGSGAIRKRRSSDDDDYWSNFGAGADDEFFDDDDDSSGGGGTYCSGSLTDTERIAMHYELLGNRTTIDRTLPTPRCIVYPDCVDDVNAYRRLLEWETAQQAIREKLISVDIFYRELKQERYDEQAEISEENLAGNIGGLLGLFIGATATTIVEFFEFCTVMLYYWLWVKCSKQYRNIGKTGSHNVAPRKISKTSKEAPWYA